MSETNDTSKEATDKVKVDKVDKVKVAQQTADSAMALARKCAEWLTKTKRRETGYSYHGGYPHQFGGLWCRK